jgi:VIT1/CCC1 family predicted Fe2+/Mn2+ transporter
MGQVIAFPDKRDSKRILTEDRRHALITGLCALTFLLGFFIIGPSLAIFAFGFATTSHIGSAVACVAGLALTWVLTRVAYKHL